MVVVRAGFGRGWIVDLGLVRDGDGVADSDRVLVNQDVLDQQPDDSLPFRNIHCIGGCTQPREEAIQGFGEPQIGFCLACQVDDRLYFGVHSLLLASQPGDSLAQFVDGDQLLLVGIDQTVDAVADTRRT